VSSTPWMWSYERAFCSDMTVAHSLIQDVLGQLVQRGWGPHDLFAVEMGLEEAFANAIHHGNHDNPLKKVSFSCQLSENLVRFQIEDEGDGFDPETLADPRDPANLERASGRGVCLIYNFMSRVIYSECGKRITMEKEIKNEK